MITIPRKKKEETLNAVVVVNDKTGEAEVITEKEKEAYQRICTAYASMGYSPWSNTEDHVYLTEGRMNIRQVLEPKHRRNIISKGIEYSIRQSDVNRAMFDKRNFASSKFQIYVQEEEQRKWLENICKDLGFNDFLSSAFFFLFSVQQVPYIYRYWGKDKNRPTDKGEYYPKFIYILPPQDILPIKSIGGYKIFWDIQDEAIKKWAQKGSAALKPIDEFKTREAVEPMKQAIMSRQMLDLDKLKEYGYGWGFMSDSAISNGDGNIPFINSIFSDLQYLQICKDAEFNAIIQCKVGFIQITKGSQTPTKDTPRVTLGQLKELESDLGKQIANKMPTLFTAADVNIKWIVPPMEMFTTEKYTKAEQRVKNWLGLPSEMWGGNQEKGSYASAYMSSKPIQQEILKMRGIVEGELNSLFSDWSLKNNFTNINITTSFDANVFKESKQILDEERFMQDAAISSARSTQIILGRNPDYENITREKELEEEKHIHQPFYDRVKGLGDNEPGRPETSGEPTPDNTLRTPRQSSAQVIDKLTAELNMLKAIEITDDYIIIALKDGVETDGEIIIKEGFKAELGKENETAGAEIIKLIFNRKNYNLEKAREIAKEFITERG